MRSFARTILTIAILAGPGCALADQSTPEATFEEFRTLNASGELQSEKGKALRTGEAASWSSPSTGPMSPASRIIHIDATHAVARFATTYRDGGTIDAYIYLSENEGAWRIAAGRSFALTEMPRAIQKQLASKGALSPEEEELKRNIDLTLSTDEALAAWFAAHEADLNEITSHIATPEAPAVLARLKALGLSAISAENGTTFIVIGGMGDNIVGFLKPGPEGSPKISPSGYIWIESLSGGWFFYRTT